MTQVVTPTRVFRFGALTLADPDPSMSPQEVLEAYSATYPALAASAISEPEVSGDTLTYQFEAAVAKTKG